jgi:protocatechuate 3,4-dioxygenase alpha subunit
MSMETTSSQTIGPYLHIGLTWLITDNIASPGVAGDKVMIEGRMIDGDANPVTDAIVEIWQANAHGRYAHPDDTQDKPLEPAFKGFGRVTTDNDGFFRFTTIKPGRVRAQGDELQAPHLNVTIFTRGLLKHLITRMYFPNDSANDEDPVLQSVPPDRRATLIATPIAGKGNAVRWDVVLQGNNETVFFDY